MTENLAEKIRSRLNTRAGEEVTRQFTEDDKLLQISSWIELKQFFKDATGGEGFPCGHITQIIGEPDSGKTTLVMEGAVSCQKAGGVVYLIDTENKFDLKRLALMGGNPRDIIIYQVDSLEEAWSKILLSCQEVKELRAEGVKVPMMIIWDSIAASVPRKILEEEESGDAHVAVEAKINNKNIRKLRLLIRESDTACVFINHFYTTMPKPGSPPKEIIKGGEELTFLSTLIVKTKKGAKIERTSGGEDEHFGRVTRYQVIKGHFSGRYKLKDVYVVDRGILETKEELEAYKKSLRGK